MQEQTNQNKQDKQTKELAKERQEATFNATKKQQKSKCNIQMEVET